MTIWGYLLVFLAGALLSNGIPHFVSGVLGAPFPTPFAKPHGVGDSSPIVNVLWGFGNGIVGALLALRWLPHDVAPIPDAVCAGGFLVMALFTARHFGKVRSAKG